MGIRSKWIIFHVNQRTIYLLHVTVAHGFPFRRFPRLFKGDNITFHVVPPKSAAYQLPNIYHLFRAPTHALLISLSLFRWDCPSTFSLLNFFWLGCFLVCIFTANFMAIGFRLREAFVRVAEAILVWFSFQHLSCLPWSFDWDPVQTLLITNTAYTQITLLAKQSLGTLRIADDFHPGHDKLLPSLAPDCDRFRFIQFNAYLDCPSNSWHVVCKNFPCCTDAFSFLPFPRANGLTKKIHKFWKNSPDVSCNRLHQHFGLRYGVL